MIMIIQVFFYKMSLMFPTFFYEADYYNDYYFASPWFLDYNICEGDFCLEKEVWVDTKTETKVPNTELVLYDDDYNQVGMAGLMAECAPGQIYPAEHWRQYEDLYLPTIPSLMP